MSKFYPKSNEESVKYRVIDKLINEKGWKLDKNLYIQQQSGSKKRIADLTCLDKNGDPLIVFEIKDRGKSRKTLEKALGEQAVEWAVECEAPIAYATDGGTIKTWQLSKTKREQIEKELDEKNTTDRKERAKIIFKSGKPLILNGQEVKEFLDEETALKYLETNEHNNIDEKVITSREELVRLFASANKELRKAGLESGIERFGEFCNLLFLKLLSEEEEKREKLGQLRIGEEARWSSLKGKRGKELLKHINNTVLKEFQSVYDKDIFSSLKIENHTILETIVNRLNYLSLTTANSDTLGETFEYFLKAYLANQKKDLGQYFTPRHLVNFLVELANPRLGEEIYDPFCGTGGILIQAYRHVKTWMIPNEDNQEKLRSKTFYGREITRNLCRTAKMNMILAGDGHNNVERTDSLKNPIENRYDVVITNMPFSLGNYWIEYEDEEGKKHKIKDKEYSDQYFLKSNDGDFLCIEHCFKAIRENNPNARIVMIAPWGILVNDNFTKLREFIYENSYVEHIISLPAKSFYPYASAKATILHLTSIKQKGEEKRKQKEIWYFEVKNDGFTLDTKRKAKEGESDLDIFQKYKDSKEEKLGFSKLDMETVKNNNYISIPNVYREFTFDSQYDIFPLKELVEEITKKNDINAPVWSVTNDRGFVLSEENFKEKRSSENVSDYKLVSPKCFAYNPSYISVGSICYNDSEETGCVTHYYVAFRVKNKAKIIPQYLSFLFKSEKFKEQVNNYAFGAVRENLSFEEFQKIKVPVPSLQKQEKIVDGLSKIEWNIQNSRQIINNLNSPLFISLMKHKRTEKLGNIATFEYGYTTIASEQGEFRLIRITDINEHGEITEQEKKYVNLENKEEIEKYTLKKGDVMVTRVGSTVGKTALFESEEKAIFASYLIRIRFGEEIILPEYYWCFTKSPNYWQQVNDLVGGTAQPQFNANFLKEITVPIPSLEEQKKVIEEIKKIKKNSRSVKSIIDDLKSSLSLSLSLSLRSCSRTKTLFQQSKGYALSLCHT